MSRITCPVLQSRVTTAEKAAEQVKPGNSVGMSGFTGAGYPKALPTALAARMISAHDRGEEFRIGLWTARRPHRARCADHRHRAGSGRPARALHQGPGREGHRPLCPPDFRARLIDYTERAQAARPQARHTPHLLDEALSWHQHYLDHGRM